MWGLPRGERKLYTAQFLYAPLLAALAIPVQACRSSRSPMHRGGFGAHTTKNLASPPPN
jgi:hypothetical protein